MCTIDDADVHEATISVCKLEDNCAVSNVMRHTAVDEVLLQLASTCLLCRADRYPGTNRLSGRPSSHLRHEPRPLRSHWKVAQQDPSM